jgi:ribonuclease HI
VSKTKNKFYVVWKGRKTGIFASWKECEDQVKGFQGAKYKGFPNKAAAKAAWKSKPEDYIGKTAASQKPLFGPGGPEPNSYCVDAACSGNPGMVEYRGVFTMTGKQIFHQGPFEHGTNNIGEFLALVHALSYFKKKGIAEPIYSDSINAMSWVKKKKCRTKLEREDRNTRLFDLVDKAEHWLVTNTYTNKILKWDTANWGEIPADFGRK